MELGWISEYVFQAEFLILINKYIVYNFLAWLVVSLARIVVRVFLDLLRATKINHLRKNICLEKNENVEWFVFIANSDFYT